jgi:CxxC motif-containing protein (DUF1111 family)
MGRRNGHGCAALALLSAVVITMAACERVEPTAQSADQLLDGPVDGLTHAQSAEHLRGDQAFTDEVFTAETGLGPRFVATSCASCHAGDGKGHPFTTLTRFGQSDRTGNHFLDRGGPQLQNRALPGVEPEQLPAGAASARFTPPITSGLGFLELVPDADLLALADPNDTNGDGIRGVPNWVSLPTYETPRPGAVTQGGLYIGRFGKKASVYSLLQQTAGAYSEDIGITSVFEPVDVYSGKETDPEVTTGTVHAVVFYLSTLKAPIQRDQSDPGVKAGKEVFIRANCSGCHTPQLTTSFSPIEALSNKTIAPYTDLLLHDMGPGLNDGYTEGAAEPAQWRTPPLWGLGLSPKSQGGQFFLLHDGRARSIEEAILMHGGEATTSVQNFHQLSSEERRLLFKFLESL